MASEFIGRVVAGALCPRIIIPKEVIDLVKIKDGDDIHFERNDELDIVYLSSKSDEYDCSEAIEEAKKRKREE